VYRSVRFRRVTITIILLYGQEWVTFSKRRRRNGLIAIRARFIIRSSKRAARKTAVNGFVILFSTGTFRPVNHTPVFCIFARLLEYIATVRTYIYVYIVLCCTVYTYNIITRCFLTVSNSVVRTYDAAYFFHRAAVFERDRGDLNRSSRAARFPRPEPPVRYGERPVVYTYIYYRTVFGGTGPAEFSVAFIIFFPPLRPVFNIFRAIDAQIKRNRTRAPVSATDANRSWNERFRRVTFRRDCPFSRLGLPSEQQEQRRFPRN